jgi:hypothetical protein
MAETLSPQTSEAEQQSKTPDNTGDWSVLDPENAPNNGSVVRRAIVRLEVIRQEVIKGIDDGSERREDLKDDARESLRKIGRGALEAGKSTLRFGVGIDLLAAEAAGKGVTYVREKLVLLGNAAKERWQARQKRKLEKKWNDAQDKHMESVREEADADHEVFENTRKANEQNEAYDTYEDNIETTARREDQEDAYDTYEDNISTAEKNERRRERAQAKAAAARLRKAQRAVKRARRSAQRRETFANVASRVSNSRIGRAARFVGRGVKGAARVTARATKAGLAGASAAKASWDAQKR